MSVPGQVVHLDAVEVPLPRDDDMNKKAMANERPKEGRLVQLGSVARETPSQSTWKR